MQRWYTLSLAAVLGGLAWISAPPARSQAVPGYTFTDLGAPGPTYSTVVGINDSGQIAGYFTAADGNNHAYRVLPLDTNADGTADTWYRDGNGDGQNDLLQVLPVPAGIYYWTARSINGLGQVTGCVYGGRKQPQSPAVWGMSGLPTVLRRNNRESLAEGYGINDSGDVIAMAPENASHLWRFVNGSYVWSDLGAPAGSTGAHVPTINNSRQVAASHTVAGATRAHGWSQSQGWFSLGQIPGHAGGVSAAAINQAGQIVGGSSTGQIIQGQVVPHGFIWLPAASGSLPAGINDAHDFASGWTRSRLADLDDGPGGSLRAVGWAYNDTTGVQKAVLWSQEDGLMRDLNSLTVNLPAGWNLLTAATINNRGQIAGYGKFQGVTRACVLNPVQ